MKLSPKTAAAAGVVGILAAGAGASFLWNIPVGKEIASNAWLFSKDIILILPMTFILIGLFEAWVRKEVIERHLGKDSGARGYTWAVLMGGTVVGPALVALPVAYALQKKGASTTVCLVFIGSATVCRIPMTLFEASFLGVEFTLLRYAIALPLVVAASIMIGKTLERKNYSISEVIKEE